MSTKETSDSRSPGIKLSLRNGKNPRKWIILAVATYVAVTTFYNQFGISVLAPEIIRDLQINNAQFASLISAPMLAGALLAIMAGGLADRYGVKRVVTVAFIASLIGMAVRIAAETYPMYFFSMFLLGCTAVITAANVARLMRAWFGVQGVGFAVAVFLTAGPVGTTLSQLTVPHLPSSTAFYWLGFMLFALAFILWIALIQDAPTTRATQSPHVVPSARAWTSIKHVVTNPHVLLAGIGSGLFMGAQITFSSFLPSALTNDHDFTLSDAGAVAALYTLGTIAGNLLAPPLTNRLGRIKPVLVISGLVAAALIFSAWTLASTPFFNVLVFLAGVALGMTIVLIIAAPALLRSVDPSHVGAAGGVIGTMEGAGAFLLPSMVLAPLAGDNFTMLFALAALCAALLSLVMSFVPDFGRRMQTRTQEAVFDQNISSRDTREASSQGLQA